MIVPPVWRRPAPGGGLAVLVVVTVVAALAAPHAQAVRGLVVGGGRMVEALGQGVPVRQVPLRRGWLGAVRPGGHR